MVVTQESVCNSVLNLHLRRGMLSLVGLVRIVSLVRMASLFRIVSLVRMVSFSQNRKFS